MEQIKTEKISLLMPMGKLFNFNTMSDVTIHDLGMDLICKKLSGKEAEQNLIMKILAKTTDNPEVTRYRVEVFSDIYKNKTMREDIMKILEKINFLRDYGSFKREYEEAAAVWDLMHRLEEINDYISCVESLYSCLEKAELESEGLIGLKEYVKSLYFDQGFEVLKKDIEHCKASTTDLKSVTVGINLNSRFECREIGIVSINNKSFSKSNIIGGFTDFFVNRDNVNDNVEWKENYKFHPFQPTAAQMMADEARSIGNSALALHNPLFAVNVLGLASVPEGDQSEDTTRYMDRITNHMLSLTVKKLRTVLNKYVNITITDITGLIPEFMYYIRWAEFIEKLVAAGNNFCKPEIATGEGNRVMHARGIYNVKLATVMTEERTEIVTNDLDFDDDKRVYILTGANRGGKTTITQAIGQLYIMAQGGIYVPGDSFSFMPANCIYTHFPADEDKTMDLGRLGEECKRFRDLYKECTKTGLLLLNETFSTTSFEEGYYIARDSVKAILNKGIRTIYNTHMHKLAFDIDEMNEEALDGKAKSLIVKTEEGSKRSYKVEIATPVGKSFAKDIAEKYGVTYEMLISQ